MTSFERLKALVTAALELPEAERAAYLDSACGDDAELRREVESLLSVEEPAGGFLGRSPVRPGGAEAALEAGTRLGAWRVLEPLGAGGMGEVYLAERADGAFEQRAAVKVIRARGLLGGELLGRFLAERQLLAELDHPHIARLLDGGTTGDGRPFLVLEYVEGEPIDRWCEARRLPVEARLRLFLGVCDAVEQAHRRLVVHRDLKPANILVTAEGVPKLLDFGVAKDLGAAGTTPATRLLVPLTPEYASPEQLTGGTVTTGSDVYSLGVVLYELLVGTSPFGDGADPLAGRTRAAPPARPSTRVGRRGDRRARRLRRRLAGDLDHIVLRALEPDPAARYPSVEQLSRDLRRHLAGLPLESREGKLYRLGMWGRRHWKAAVAVALVLVLAGGAGWQALERRRAEQEALQTAWVAEGLSTFLIDIFSRRDAEGSGKRDLALEELVDRAAELLNQGALDRGPMQQAALLGAIGQIYRQQDRSTLAEPLLRETLALRLQSLPPDHELIGVAHNNLGLALRGVGKLAEARDSLEQAQRIWLLHNPGDTPELARMLSNLAGVEKELGFDGESVAHFQEALEMKRRLPEAFGERALAVAVKNLGTGLAAAGRLDEAEAAFREALAELDRLGEGDSTARASVEHALGSLLRKRGEAAAARPLLESALAVRESAWHPEHRQVLGTLLELAQVDALEGRLEIAEERMRQVVALRRVHLGGDHPDLAEALVPLAELSAQKGEATAARAAAEEALVILRNRLPAGHPRIGEVEGLAERLRP